MTDKPKVNTDSVDREGGREGGREENYVILLIPSSQSIHL